MTRHLEYHPLTPDQIEAWANTGITWCLMCLVRRVWGQIVPVPHRVAKHTADVVESSGASVFEVKTHSILKAMAITQKGAPDRQQPMEFVICDMGDKVECSFDLEHAYEHHMDLEDWMQGMLQSHNKGCTNSSILRQLAVDIPRINVVGGSCILKDHSDVDKYIKSNAPLVKHERQLKVLCTQASLAAPMYNMQCKVSAIKETHLICEHSDASKARLWVHLKHTPQVQIFKRMRLIDMDNDDSAILDMLFVLEVDLEDKFCVCTVSSSRANESHS